MVWETLSPDFPLISAAELDVRKRDNGFLNDVGDSSLPDNYSEEARVDRDNHERDYLVNKGEGARLISTTGGGCVGETKRRVYSRSEMEALRFLDVDTQRRMWNEVYCGLEATVAREYNRLRVPNHHSKEKQGNSFWGKFGGKKDYFGVVGKVLSLSLAESGIFISSDAAYGDTLVDGKNYTNKEASFCEDNNMGEFELNDVDDDDSDDEYASIQRPAFLVEGEPDFDSGPPIDGLEYLRRVRWEALQIPGVKVARLNLSNVSGERTPYMPSIPDIAECPLNLSPSKHWEDAFLADFSKLRQAFSELEKFCATKESWNPSVCRQKPKGDPTLTAILAMDVASRAFILRSCISSFETASTLSRADCLWLYAISATVDAPLDVDTCASVRCLLRKCSILLAAKSELDDEVSMLSILIAIAGKYFGQSESR